MYKRSLPTDGKGQCCEVPGSSSLIASNVLNKAGVTQNKEKKDQTDSGTPSVPTMESCSSWRSAIALLWDKVYFEVCIFAVRLAIVMQSIPILNDLGRRLTLMSGNLDTNANLCLFLRQLYSRTPAPLTYDPQEIYFASMFLEAQYKVLSWIVTHGSWRLLPPLLRPLFKAYYGRARHAREFIVKCIEQFEVEQIVILGAGFDSNAYRSRELRIIREEKLTRRYVTVFEVDRPEVNRLKVSGLKRHMTDAEFRYYAEGVVYVVCNFGVDSLEARLLEHGFNPRLSTAVLWEGVTYYLDRTALNATLSELRNLFSVNKDKSQEIALEEHQHVAAEMRMETPQISRIVSAELSGCAASTTASHEESVSSRKSSSCRMGQRNEAEPPTAVAQSNASSFAGDTIRTAGMGRSDSQVGYSSIETEAPAGAVYLFMDYMLVSGTLNQKKMEEDRLWRLNNLLADALGTRFITGFVDASSELEPFGWKCINHITYEDVELRYFTNLPEELRVFEERNTTYGHNEPRLNCVECVFTEREPPTTWH